MVSWKQIWLSLILCAFLEFFTALEAVQPNCPDGTKFFMMTNFGESDIVLKLKPNLLHVNPLDVLLGSLTFVQMKGRDKILFLHKDRRKFKVTQLGFFYKKASSIKIDIYDQYGFKLWNTMAYRPPDTTDWNAIDFSPRVPVWTKKIILRFFPTAGSDNSWVVKDMFMCGCV